MKKILFTIAILALPVMAKAQINSSIHMLTAETLPSSQQSTTTFAGAMGYTSAVTISSFTITRADTALNAFFATSSNLGAGYQRVEVTVQNNDTTDKFCGFASSGLTIANSFKIAVGSTWSFKVGKGLGIYCLNAAGSSGTMIVGGVAWK